MTQVDGYFFERPASLARAMSEIMTQIMKGHAGNTSPFFLVSLVLYVHPEMLYPPLGKVIWLSLLA